jgi:hypothetical protein
MVKEIRKAPTTSLKEEEGEPMECPKSSLKIFDNEVTRVIYLWVRDIIQGYNIDFVVELNHAFSRSKL